MTKYFIGIVAALLGALGGAWLLVAPFALAYQPEGAGWADPTLVDFWSGLGILLLSVAGIVLYTLGLIEELREQGVVERRPPRASRQSRDQSPNVQPAGPGQQPAAEGSRQSGSDLDQVLLPLVTAMLQDMKDRQAERETNSSTPNSTGWSAEREERKVQ